MPSFSACSNDFKRMLWCSNLTTENHCKPPRLYMIFPKQKLKYLSICIYAHTHTYIYIYMYVHTIIHICENPPFPEGFPLKLQFSSNMFYDFHTHLPARQLGKKHIAGPLCRRCLQSQGLRIHVLVATCCNMKRQGAGELVKSY